MSVPMRFECKQLSHLVGKPTMLFSNSELYKYRRSLEAGKFGFRKYRNCTISVAKTKALISFAVTEKLICTFDFTYADCWFSPEAAQFLAEI